MRKLKTDKGATHIYKYYCKKSGNPLKLTMAEFTELTKQFFDRVIGELINKGIEFSFPHRMGALRVARYKNRIRLNKYGNLDKRKLAPDWKKTKELWAIEYPGKTLAELKGVPLKPIVYHTNRHTDGYTHKWYWDRSTCIAKNSSGYALEISRTVDRRLAKALQDNPDLDFMNLNS